MTGAIEIGDTIITKQYGKSIVYDILNDEYYKIRVVDEVDCFITMWVSKNIIEGIIKNSDKGEVRVTISFVMKNNDPNIDILDGYIGCLPDICFSGGLITVTKTAPKAHRRYEYTHLEVEKIDNSNN